MHHELLTALLDMPAMPLEIFIHFRSLPASARIMKGTARSMCSPQVSGVPVQAARKELTEETEDGTGLCEDVVLLVSLPGYKVQHWNLRGGEQAEAER